MDFDSEKFVFRTIGAVVLIFALSVGGCAARQNELIAKSADPLATACAIAQNEKACILVAERN